FIRYPIFSLFPYTTLFRSDFVGDNLKGFLDLLFRANIAREAQGALSALFHGFGGGLFCGFGIFVEYGDVVAARRAKKHDRAANRSEEHTSELQSPCNLVCR